MRLRMSASCWGDPSRIIGIMSYSCDTLPRWVLARRPRMSSLLLFSSERAPTTGSRCICSSTNRSWISREISLSIARRLAHTSTRPLSLLKPMMDDAVTK